MAPRLLQPDTRKGVRLSLLRNGLFHAIMKRWQVLLSIGNGGMMLYEELKLKAQEDVQCKLKLDALVSVLDHFKIEGEERDVVGNEILRIEEISRNRRILAADEKMKKLIEMYNFFRGSV